MKSDAAAGSPPSFMVDTQAVAKNSQATPDSKAEIRLSRSLVMGVGGAFSGACRPTTR